MARGSSQATGAATSAQNLSNTLEGNAGNLYGQLAPELEAEAAHPAGMNPTDIAKADTAAQQSAGGSQAAAVGQGGLLAARTRNAGGADAAIGSAARSAGRNLSQSALKTQLENAQLKEHEHQAGMTGLENLNAGQTGAGIQSLGIVPQAVNANTNAQNASWDWAKYLVDPMMSAAGSAI